MSESSRQRAVSAFGLHVLPYAVGAAAYVYFRERSLVGDEQLAQHCIVACRRVHSSSEDNERVSSFLDRFKAFALASNGFFRSSLFASDRQPLTPSPRPAEADTTTDSQPDTQEHQPASSHPVEWLYMEEWMSPRAAKAAIESDAYRQLQGEAAKGGLQGRPAIYLPVLACLSERVMGARKVREARESIWKALFT
mmetsp:Transcript_38311/g.95969  ORF Transcript_38311/g.95969 Transcript_38311/m.95969 type:complete len:195 (-) Transcript_38311:71-655(-)